MKANFPLILLFFLFSCSDQGQEAQPKVTKGILDLSGWEFEKKEPVMISGEWEFYWLEFFNASPIKKATSFMPVPEQWQSFGYPAIGYATYRAEIILPKDVPALSLDMKSVACAYQIFINGHLVAKQGKAGKSKSESQPYLRHTIFHLSPSLIEESNQKLEIVINVSNFHYFKGGLWDTISLGSTRVIQKNERKQYTVDVILLSCLFIMGLYHLGLYFTRKKDKSTLYFAFFVFVVSIRTSSINDRLLMDLFPFLTFEITNMLEYLTINLSGIIFLLFVEALFPEEARKKWSRFLMLFFVPTAIVVILTPMYIFGQLLTFVEFGLCIEILYVVILLCLAMKAKRVGAKLFISGFLILASTVIHDILKGKQLVYTPYLAGYGLLTFIVFQATILSRKFASAFLQSEHLAEELLVFSKELEEKVIQRTSELQSSLEQVKNLKQQQDGDYFLTSLLLRPLNKDKSKNEKVKIEFLTSQKKKFQFRDWQEEIGGDLSMANVITLRGKTYTVFVNVDAMGKSLQGASGALVFGSVFESIINRNQMVKNTQNVYPEVWIKDAFVELHHVFETFDGSMLVSLVMGLIEETTRTLFMINADHPPSILYRDGKASFFGQEKSFRKLGTLGANEWIQIYTTQLSFGDVVILGSDGRDDLLLPSKDSENRINEDENLILTFVEKSNANLEEMYQEMMSFGKQYDDLSLLKISFSFTAKETNDFGTETKENTTPNKDKSYFLSLLKTGNFEKAKEVAESILEFLEADTEFLFLFSYVLKKTKNFLPAVEIGERVRLRTPFHTRNLINMADVHSKMGKIKRAEDILITVLKIDPSNPHAKRRLARLQRKVS